MSFKKRRKIANFIIKYMTILGLGTLCMYFFIIGSLVFLEYQKVKNNIFQNSRLKVVKNTDSGIGKENARVYGEIRGGKNLQDGIPSLVGSGSSIAIEWINII